MNISLNWLKEYIEITLGPKKIEAGLTALGLECTIQKQNYPFTNVWIGLVKECVQHPNADKLSICQVYLGNKETVQIVCGAPNVKKGLKVPVIKVGGTLDSGKFKIKRTKLRGEESNGMICSEKELGLGSNHKGIMELDTDLLIGTDFEFYLQKENDIHFDFELTPNRGDCFSHLGVAREIALLEKAKIKKRNISLIESEELTSNLISIKIEDTDACKRYATRIIKGVKIEKSPQWLSDKLISIGLKSVNNIVDAANFIMMDNGHPMHTFDYDKISGQEINVRIAKPNEKMVILDSTEINLDKHHLLICDSKEPIAIAGVIGGLNSGINEKSKNVLIECAYFEPKVIRKSAKSLDISTDATKRFERDTDLNTILDAVDQLASLIQKIAGGEISKGILDVGQKSKQNEIISFSSDKCNRFLGTNLIESEFNEIFNLLTIDFNKKNGVYLCSIPTFRNDLEREVDLFEEIARVYGYDNISEKKSFTSNYNTFIKDDQESFNKLREISASNGFLEHYSNSLISKINSTLFSNHSSIELTNPLNKEMTFLRNSLIPGLLNAISINERRQQSRFKLLEIGQIHKKVDSKETTSVENSAFGLAWYDSGNPHWRKLPKLDFYQAKRDLFLILNKMGCSNLKVKETETLGFDIALEVKNKKYRIGVLGIISKKMLNQFNITNDVILFDGDLQKLSTIYNDSKYKYKAISQFPTVTRDIALLVNSDVASGKMSNTIKQNGGDILKSIILFDLYQGKELGENKKSMAYSLKFQSDDQTLNDKIIDKYISKVILALEKNHGAIQR